MKSWTKISKKSISVYYHLDWAFLDDTTCCFNPWGTLKVENIQPKKNKKLETLIRKIHYNPENWKTTSGPWNHR